jgi:hypothetical protein
MPPAPAPITMTSWSSEKLMFHKCAWRSFSSIVAVDVPPFGRDAQPRCMLKPAGGRKALASLRRLEWIGVFYV